MPAWVVVARKEEKERGLKGARKVKVKDEKKETKKEKEKETEFTAAELGHLLQM